MMLNRKSLSSRSWLRALVFSLALGSLPACIGTNGASGVGESTSSTLASSSLSGNDQWNCPVYANVTDPNPSSYSGEGDYTICRSKQTAGKFMIQNRGASPAVCVYPMVATSSSSASLVETPQCYKSVVTFTNANINYLVIVSANYTNQMNSCLSSRAGCPPYAEGLIQ